jgi:hypothetical protein
VGKLNKIISHTCDLILILKTIDADKEILGIVASYENNQTEIECWLTQDCFLRLVNLFIDSYDEYISHKKSKMMRIGCLRFFTEKTNSMNIEKQRGQHNE